MSLSPVAHEHHYPEDSVGKQVEEAEQGGLPSRGIRCPGKSQTMLGSLGLVGYAGIRVMGRVQSLDTGLVSWLGYRTREEASLLEPGRRLKNIEL